MNKNEIAIWIAIIAGSIVIWEFLNKKWKKHGR